MEQFKKGDYVKLPLMTIESMEGNIAHCVWQDGSETQSGKFSMAALQLDTPPDRMKDILDVLELNKKI